MVEVHYIRDFRMSHAALLFWVGRMHVMIEEVGTTRRLPFIDEQLFIHWKTQLFSNRLNDSNF